MILSHGTPPEREYQGNLRHQELQKGQEDGERAPINHSRKGMCPICANDPLLLIHLSHMPGVVVFQDKYLVGVGLGGLG